MTNSARTNQLGSSPQYSQLHYYMYTTSLTVVTLPFYIQFTCS